KLFSELKSVLDDLVKSFISEVAVNSASVPVIYTDSTKLNVLASGNVDSVKILDTTYLKTTIASMASINQPIEVEFGDGSKSYIFYQESMLLTQLKYYPYVMFGIVGLFLLIAYLLFSTARKVEQNQVWVGMAKETAHQLGTPLSSLIAWLEYLKSKGLDHETSFEIEKDIKRLETITDRFSKIGSVPKLDKVDLLGVLNESVNYIKLRTSKNVLFTIDAGNQKEVMAQLNVPLFEWVIENLCKNAVDAMVGNGSITITISDQTQFVYIDITDTGKGIPKSKYKTVFEPGFTTKRRGWGLGLSLTKRIIENYHSGKIFVKSSDIDKGTTFRIVLNK
ncbi:MAG: HAMP domain-containing sensor histidine kinase, partial [Bacteroidota bacterium]|nr:HAMP domain-containing sensor histidine kinase [Bacteroidota bacterium]